MVANMVANVVLRRGKHQCCPPSLSALTPRGPDVDRSLYGEIYRFYLYSSASFIKQRATPSVTAGNALGVMASLETWRSARRRRRVFYDRHRLAMSVWRVLLQLLASPGKAF